MRVRIRRDERYPDYSLDESGAAVLDVDDDTAARWQRVQADYEAMQDELDERLSSVPEYFDGRYWRI